MRKYLLFLISGLIACSFSAVYVLAGADSDSGASKTNSEINLGYYENLGSMAFIYLGELYSRENDMEEKTKIANQYAFMLFYYWHSVVTDDIPSSTKVLKAGRKVPSWHFSIHDMNVFDDPLMWLDHQVPKMTSQFKDVTKSEYIKLLSRFKEYMNTKDSTEQTDPPDKK